MKRQLLSFVFILFALTTFAQSQGMYSVKANEVKLDKNVPHNTNWVFPSNQKSNTLIRLGTSFNVYSILREGQTQVDYNKDLNSVSFTHRQNIGNAGGSGVISFDISTDGGLTWDTTNKQITPQLITDPVLNGNRYPNGVIFNPSGNTDVNNARIVGVGGALTSVTGSWGMVYQTSAKFDGSGLAENYLATPDTNSLIPGGLTVIGDDVYAADWWSNGWKAVLHKFTYDGTGDFTASEIFLELDTAAIGADNLATAFGGAPNLAFSHDGQTGYLVIHASTNEHGTYAARPAIWKSTDGGATWNALPGIDYTAPEHADLLSWTIVPNNDTSATPRPYMRNFDMTVDKNNDLHIFANMGSSSDTLDPGFIWVSTLNTNSVWHFKTTDGTSYESNLVDPWLNTWGDIAGDGERWFGPRPQASRSADGSKLFFTYTMTDTLLWGTTSNIAPDVMGYAMNLDNGVDTIKNLTAGSAAEAVGTWATISTTVIEGTNGVDFEIPVVYGENSGDDLTPLQYWYVQGTGFSLAELTLINTEELEREALNVKVFPNPTSGQVNLDLRTLTDAVDVQVVNLVGQTITSMTEQRGLVSIDLSSVANGVYFVRVSSGDAVVTKKVMLNR